MKKFRFAVGSTDGLRSTVWTLWTSRGEFYLQSRMMGGSVKVSIHSSGVAQYSMQSEWYGKNRPNQPNRNRHIDKWEWKEPVDTVASIVFRMCIPQSELRRIDEPEDLEGVKWLAEPGLGRQIQVVCYVSPAPVETAPINEPRFLCALEREVGSIVIFAYPAEVSPDDIRQRDLVLSQVIQWAIQSGREIRPRHRIAGLAVDSAGLRTLIEFAPSLSQVQEDSKNVET